MTNFPHAKRDQLDEKLAIAHMLRMLCQHTTATLLWRLRKESALYVFGSGASAPIVHMVPALMWNTLKNFNDLGSLPSEPVPKSVFTSRMQEQIVGQNFNDRSTLPSYPELSDEEILDHLSHDGAIAGYIEQLAAARYAGRRVPNYLVLRYFRRSLLLNYNLDGLATDTCGDHHLVIAMHGSVAAMYGSAAGAKLVRDIQEYGIEIPHEGLHPFGPELASDKRLQHNLSYVRKSNPAFVMIVGYSFARFKGDYDDSLSLAALVGRFRDTPIDVYVCDPRASDLADMLGESLRSKRVHAFPMYWNIMAHGFTLVLKGLLDVSRLDAMHEMTLDQSGSGFLPEQD